MVRLGLLLLMLAPQAPVFVPHPIAAPAEIAGAVLAGHTLFAWGDGLYAFDLPRGRPRTLLPGVRFAAAGCLADINQDGLADLVLQEGAPAGRLVWLEAPAWSRHQIDSGVETPDILPATLHGRRGLLIVHRHIQVRFYQPPPQAPAARWPYRDLYSFYTPSRQAGLALEDVDRDGRPDILCGNYWIRSPDRFDLPWPLYAINLYTETPASATLRLAVADLARPGSRDLAVSQGEVSGARLAWFERPADPKRLWVEHRLEGALNLQRPRAFAVADFDGDGRPDIAAGENNGARSRLLLLVNQGAGRFQPRQMGAGVAAHSAWAVDLNRDGRLDLLTAGPRSVVWWENTLQ